MNGLNAIAGGRTARRRRNLLDAVVVGGGMAGAAAALALGRAGLDVALIEAHAPRPWNGAEDVDLRVVALAPSSVQLLDELGVWEGVAAARACAYTHMHVWDAGGGATLDFDAVDADLRYLGWIAENRLLQHQLWQALPMAGVRSLCPARVQGFEEREDRVQILLDDDTRLEAAVLVAADGAASPLRARAGIRTRGHAYGQRGVVAHVHTEREHENTAWQRFLPDGPIALLPLADGRCSMVWTLPEAEAQRVLALDDAAFADAVGVASDFRLGLITASSARAAFPLHLQLATSYRRGRLVLLGDAAHVVHPLAGQGVNLGLRDVVALREALALAHDAGGDPGAASVLQRYARRRRSADTLDGRAFDLLGRMFGWKSPWSTALRGAGVALITRSPTLRRALLRHAAGIEAPSPR